MGLTGMSPSSAAQRLRQELRAARANPKVIFGFAHFGPEWPLLNERTHGLHPGELGILASQPKVGKSMFLIQIFVAIARQALAEGKGRTVDYITLEMSETNLLRRMACALAGIKDPTSVRTGFITEQEASAYFKALDEIEKLPIRFLSNTRLKGDSALSKDDSMVLGNSSVSVDDVLQFVSGNTFWWALDHIGLLANVGSGDTRRDLMVSYNKLMGLAHDTPAAGIVVTHLNRQHAGKFPTMDMLAETSQAAKNADYMFLLSRPAHEAPQLVEPDKAELMRIAEPAYNHFVSRESGEDVFTWIWDVKAAKFREAVLAPGTPLPFIGSKSK